MANNYYNDETENTELKELEQPEVNRQNNNSSFNMQKLNRLRNKNLSANTPKSRINENKFKNNKNGSINNSSGSKLNNFFSNPFRKKKAGAGLLPGKAGEKAEQAQKMVKRAKNIAKTVKAIVKVLANPLFWKVLLVVVIVAAFFLIIITIIGAFTAEFGSDYGSSDGNNTAYIAGNPGTCQYTIDGVNYDNIEVELINCDASSEDYKVIQTVPFEKYVVGVALAEMGESAPDEALKAQIIMSRNFALKRNSAMCPSNPSECTFGLQKDGNKIRLRMCENDQVYWDYTTDIYSVDRGAVDLYSPEISSTTSGAKIWKKALSSEKRTKIDSIAKEVMGKIALNTDDKIVYTNYVDTQTQLAIQYANEGNDYIKILKKIYNNIHHITSSNETNCITQSNPVIAGDYSTWKQKDERWKNIYIGNNTIGEVGCAATSVAMAIAHSGVQTTIENLNPGTFVKAHKSNGGFTGKTGNAIIWSVNKLIVNNDFDYAYQYASDSNLNWEAKKNKIKELWDDGCTVIMQVKSGTDHDTHFVVVDEASTKSTNYTTFYMWDPGRSATDLYKTYNRTRNWGNRFLCYKKK